jgi:alkylated DNA repair protein alkB family protein 4
MKANIQLNNMHVDKCLNSKVRAEEAAAAAAAAAPAAAAAVVCIDCEEEEEQEKEKGTSPSAAEQDVGDISALVWKAHPTVPGLYLIEDFITEEEEDFLSKQLEDADLHSWKPSAFNGHCMTKYFSKPQLDGASSSGSGGSSSNFLKSGGGGGAVKKSLNTFTADTIAKEIDASNVNEMPLFLQPVVARFQAMLARWSRTELSPELRNFAPNECNANLYYRAQKDYLKPHFDDRARSGPMLVNLSLAGEAKMTYKIPPPPGSGYGNGNGGNTNAPVEVVLPRRSLQLVTKAARYSYTHEIKAQHILNEKRISVTWRQSKVTWKEIAEERVKAR